MNLGVSLKPRIVYKCSETVKKCANETEEIAQNIQRLIEKTRSGWTGAGSEEFIAYLQGIYNELSNRAENLSNISGAMYNSAQQAEEADREASAAINNASFKETDGTLNGGYCRPSSGASAAGKIRAHYDNTTLKPLNTFAKRYRIKK